MDDVTPPDSATSKRGVVRRRVSSSLPWDPPANESRRPSAYAYYKKLVHDFASLEDALEQSRLAQDDLETQLLHHREAVKAHATAEQIQEQLTWERERDRRVETICVHSSAVDAMHQQQSELEDEELRLEAELAVLHERQQHANETEAKRVYDLVHTRTSLLETELVKGQMDLSFLTQVIANATHKPSSQCNNGEAIHTIVGTIRQRRQDAFHTATVQFQQRLQSFEREKAALQHKADAINEKKQRALQILSTNQQELITGFFTTPRRAIQDTDSAIPIPSLEFAAILAAMQQPTGEIVRRVQEAEHSKASARRQLEDALAEAKRNVEIGPGRLETIRQSMMDRQQEAVRLNITRSNTAVWSVESYRPEQYAVVYFVRSLVFDWMECAVERSQSQPPTELLAMEVRRYDATHAVLRSLDQQACLLRCGVEIMREVEEEVVKELADSIYQELRYSANLVRSLIHQELKEGLFFPHRPPVNPKASTTSGRDQTTTAALRWAMFSRAWEEIRCQREKDLAPGRRLPRLLMRPADAFVNPTPLIRQSKAMSPTKTRFGFFNGGATTPIAELRGGATAKAPEPQQRQSRRGDIKACTDTPTRVKLVIQVPMIVATPHEHADRMAWERHVTLADSSFSSLPTCGLITCLQLSSDAHLIAIGTIDGEVLVFSRSDDESTAPIAVRVSPIDKVARTSSVLGIARTTRLLFSSCGQRLLAYNHRQVATLYTLTPPLPVPTPVSHSSDCFSIETLKSKPLTLAVMTELTPTELFLEPAVLPDVLERDAPVAAARLQAAPRVTVSSFEFFPSVSLIGEPSHVLCGASNGDILKLAVGDKFSATTSARPRWLLGPPNAAVCEAPKPTDTDSLRPCERAFFRGAHRTAVLFVSPIVSLIGSSETRLVSVDQDGGVAVWNYGCASFCGFGWFVPQSINHLDLTFSSGIGEMLQIQLTPDKKTLVLMVFAASSTKNSCAGRLRFVQLDLTTNNLTVKPICMEMEVVGTIPPRFALISWCLPIPKARSNTKRVSGFASSRVSYLVLLMDNALHVLSLQSGERCQPAISLSASYESKTKPPTRKAPTLLFNSIASSQLKSGGSSVATVAVAGEQHRQIRLYRFTLSPACSSQSAACPLPV